MSTENQTPEYSNEEIAQTLQAAVQGAVSVRVEDEQVAKDVVDYVTEMFQSEEHKPILSRLLEMIDALATTFSEVSLRESTIVNFLMRQLDLPRDQLLESHATTLNEVLGRIDLPQTSVIPNTLKLSEMPAPSVYTDPNSDVLKGWSLLRLDDTKWLALELGGGVQVYAVTETNDGADLLIEVKDETFTVKTLGEALTASKPEYQPNLMSDREEVVLEDVDAKYTEDYLATNPEVLTLTPGAIIDRMLKDHAVANDTSYDEKRLALPHLDDINKVIDDALAGNQKVTEQPAATPGTPVEPEVPLVEVEDVEEADDSLFKSGVTEQTEKTVAPETSEVEEEVIIEDNETVSTETLARVRQLLTTLGEQPISTNAMIANSSLGIKATIYRDVFNKLSQLEGRAVEDYSPTEVDAIKTHTDGDLMAMLHLLRQHQLDTKAKNEASARYEMDLAEETITDDPLHASFLVKSGRVKEVASQVIQYLNNNEADISQDEGERRERILEVLLSICMYDYDTEALINPDFVRSRQPNSSRMIADTRPIARAVKRFYTGRAEPITAVTDELMTSINRVFASRDHHFLDVDAATSASLINGLVDRGEYVKVGNYLVVRSHNRGHALMVMDAAKAYILFFKDTTISSEQRIDKPEHRGLLLQSLVNR